MRKILDETFNICEERNKMLYCRSLRCLIHKLAAVAQSYLSTPQSKDIILMLKASPLLAGG